MTTAATTYEGWPADQHQANGIGQLPIWRQGYRGLLHRRQQGAERDGSTYKILGNEINARAFVSADASTYTRDVLAWNGASLGFKNDVFGNDELKQMQNTINELKAKS